MKKILIAATAAGALLIAGCSSGSDSAATPGKFAGEAQLEPGTTAEIKLDGGTANVTVGQVEWIDDVNGNPMLSSTVKIEATDGTFPVSYQNFRAITKQGENLTFQPGGSYDEIMQSADIPAGETLERPVAWTGFEGREIATVTFDDLDIMKPLAKWAVVMPAGGAANATTASPTTDSKVGESSSSAEWTQNPSPAEKLQACLEFKEFAGVFGITDPVELMELVRAASNSEDEGSWDAASAEQQADAAEAARAAMSGDC